MGLSLPHLIVLALIVLLLFGRGKITDLMGDFGKGIKSFKEGIADDAGMPPAPPPVQLTAQTAPPASAAVQPAQVTVHPAPIAQPTLNGEPVPADQQTRA